MIAVSSASIKYTELIFSWLILSFHHIVYKSAVPHLYTFYIVFLQSNCRSVALGFCSIGFTEALTIHANYLETLMDSYDLD